MKIETRKCPVCKKVKSESEFYRNKGSDQPKGMCKRCIVDDTIERQRQTKIKAVEYKGGCCQKCGYNKCLNALEFHHLDPSEKDFSVSQFRLKKWDNRIISELDKCILVCANCHREIHYLDRRDFAPPEKSQKHDSLTYEECLDMFKELMPDTTKNKRYVNWPDPNIIKDLVWKIPSAYIVRYLNTSDAAIYKFCKKHGISKPGLGYWNGNYPSRDIIQGKVK